MALKISEIGTSHLLEFVPPLDISENVEFNTEVTS